MHRRQVLVVPTLCFLAACSSLPAGTSSLNGWWKPVSATLAGQVMPIEDFRGAVLILRDGAYEFGEDRGSLSVLSTGWPGALDLEGTAGAIAGRHIAASFALEGDRLVICYQLGKGARPSRLESSTGSHLLLVTFGRVA